MKLLKEIFPEDKELDINEQVFKIRKKAVAIILDGQNVGMIYTKKDGVYSLPGGGIDIGESPKQAVKREVLEETGYEIDIQNEIGMTIEYLYDFNIIQMSYCYIVISKNNTLKTNLTESEIEAGLEFQWVPFNQVLNKINANKHTHVGDIIMKKRSQILIEEIGKII